IALHGRGIGSLIAAVVSAALFAFLVWFFFGYSMYGAREDRPRVGERFPEFRLPTSEGGVFDLAAERGKQHLLIFYRGAPRSTRSSPPSMRIRSSETSRPAATLMRWASRRTADRDAPTRLRGWSLR